MCTFFEWYFVFGICSRRKWWNLFISMHWLVQQPAVIGTEGSSAWHFTLIASAFEMPEEFTQNLSGSQLFLFKYNASYLPPKIGYFTLTLHTHVSQKAQILQKIHSFLPFSASLCHCDGLLPLTFNSLLTCRASKMNSGSRWANGKADREKDGGVEYLVRFCWSASQGARHRCCCEIAATGQREGKAAAVKRWLGEWGLLK